MKNIFLITLFSILLCSCSSSVDKFKEKVFYPEPKSDVLSYYANGIPFGAFSIDTSINCIISIEEKNILGNKYFRLWILYQNNLKEPYLFEPLKIATIRIKGNNEKNYYINPEPRSAILAPIDEEKESKIIAETIGGTLKMISNNINTKNTTIKDNKGNKIEIEDGKDKSRDKNDKIVTDVKSNINDIATWYDIFLESINNGILRKNTLFQNQSVNGHIYFLLPEEFQTKKFDKFDVGTYPNPDGKDENKFDIEKSLFSLIIKTNIGEKVIEFKISKDD